MLTAQKLLFRKLNKLYFEDKTVFAPTDRRENLVRTLSLELTRFGFSLSRELEERLSTSLGYSDLVEFSREFISYLENLFGDTSIEPFYRNFPDEVMESTDAELFINAILHYISSGEIRPFTLRQKRQRIVIDFSKLRAIGLADEDDIYNVVDSLATSRTSLTPEDLNLLLANAEYLNLGTINKLPHKEIRAYCQAARFSDIKFQDSLEFDTATDLLRFIVALNKGDVSLGTPCKFGSFPRNLRRFILYHLDQLCENVQADKTSLHTHKTFWKKIAKKLHYHDYAENYLDAVIALDNIYIDDTTGYADKVNVAINHLLTIDFNSYQLNVLAENPGKFARHILPLLARYNNPDILNKFVARLDLVSNKVLIQLLGAIKDLGNENKVYFPKGNVSKYWVQPTVRTNIPTEDTMEHLYWRIEEYLVNRAFGRSPLRLGKVFIDDRLSGLFIPFSNRNASKSLKTLVRGSKIEIDTTKPVLRLFVFWKNVENSRTDIDLSANFLDENFNMVDSINFTSLRGANYTVGVHSGDIVDGTHGACEYIDLNLDYIRKHKTIKYVVMYLNSFTRQLYSQLPMCFAGWMERDGLKSGELFEPVTVAQKFDITSDNRQMTPMLFDVENNEIVWLDIAQKTGRVSFMNTNIMQNVFRTFVEMDRIDLYELFFLHRKRFDRVVDDATMADTVFTIENHGFDLSDDQRVITPSSPDILSEFLA